LVLGIPSGVAGTVSEAKDCLEEALALARQAGDDAGAGWCGALLAEHAVWSGDLDRAEALATKVMEECRRTGVRSPLGTVWSILAYTAWRRGDAEVALAHLQDAVALFRELDVPRQLSWVLAQLAGYEATCGQHEETMRDLAEVVRLDDKAGLQPEGARSLVIAAYVYFQRGDRDRATAALGAFDAAGYVWHWDGDRASVGLISDLGRQMRAVLDRGAVAAAAEAARHRSVDALIDELILRP
jgi:tetratricopeptide (TPR) repeat protein